MESMPALPLSVVLVAVTIAAWTDLWNFRIHNALTIPLFAAGIVCQGVIGGAAGLAAGVLGVLVGCVPLLVPYVRGGMGAGDIKLMAGVGAWLGPWAVLHVLIVSGLAAGVCTTCLIIWGRIVASVASSGSIFASAAPSASANSPQHPDLAAVVSLPNRRRRAIPFGALVALGVVVTAFWINGSR
jgi:prepilin peptidase CpaA